MMKLKKRIWEVIEVAKEGDRVSKIFDIFILSLIFINVIVVIIETVQGIYIRYETAFYLFEFFSVAVFTVEYIVRIWACVIDDKYSKSIFGRLKFVTQPLPVIDLLAILPFYIPLFGIDLRFIRALRLLRIFRIAKIGRYYSELRLIQKVFKSKKEELILTSVLMGLVLIISANIMFYCENSAQPEAFPNVPATMWWSVATLTTVGYGDIYPITPLGKFIGSIIAILGIGMFALPTGILGAGFVEEIQKEKKETKCPHCGKNL